MVARMFVFLFIAVAIGGVWCFLEDTKKVFVAPPLEEMTDPQYEYYLQLADTNPLDIPKPWQPGYGSAEPVDVLLTPGQEALLGSLTVVQEVPWWLWRTESGSITYAQFNHRMNQLQHMLLVGALTGVFFNLIIRFLLKGGAGLVLVGCVVFPLLNLIYLFRYFGFNINEGLSLYSITAVICMIFTQWPHPGTDPDYRRYRQRYER